MINFYSFQVLMILIMLNIDVWLVLLYRIEWNSWFNCFNCFFFDRTKWIFRSCRKRDEAVQQTIERRRSPRLFHERISLVRRISDHTSVIRPQRVHLLADRSLRRLFPVAVQRVAESLQVAPGSGNALVEKDVAALRHGLGFGVRSETLLSGHSAQHRPLGLSQHAHQSTAATGHHRSRSHSQLGRWEVDRLHARQKSCSQLNSI